MHEWSSILKILFPMRSKSFAMLLLAIAVSLAAAPISAVSAPIPAPVRLAKHVPVKAVVAATLIGGLNAATNISMAFLLAQRNQEELQNLLKCIYDPADPLYGQYLTPAEFTDRFGPTQEDYDTLIAYARGLGLTVTGIHPNRMLLDVSGPARVTEAAFNLHLQQYKTRKAGSSMLPTTTLKFPTPFPHELPA